jgi:HAMP domain-containing protein
MNLGQIEAKAKNIVLNSSDAEVKELARAVADLARYVNVHIDKD